MRTKSHFSSYAALLALIFSVTTNASDLAIPNTFESGTPAVAAEVNDNFTAVETAVDDNNARIAALESTITDLQALVADQAALISSLQDNVDTNTNDIGTLQTNDGLQDTAIGDLQIDLTGVENSEVLKLENYLTVDTLNDPRGPLVVLSGVNLQVNNGSGFTLPDYDSGIRPNGLGNIIIGYDEGGGIGIDICSYGEYTTQTECENNGFVWSDSHKSGSHYLVVGSVNNYSQGGGIVAGHRNSSNNIGASVVGGSLNFSSGLLSNTVGGFGNEAIGTVSAIVGGQQNVANGDYSVILGGNVNRTEGQHSVVGGGFTNLAEGQASTVSGGANRSATGENDWVGGSLNSTD